MKAPYDIGVGRCREIVGDLVYVSLDALIAKRLAPESPWSRSGTSILRCRSAYCSKQRPPKADEECYLDSAALAGGTPAEIDVFGNGRFRDVDLRTILTAMTPIGAAPTPPVKVAFPRRGK